jgi:hypothetical protein
MKCCVCGNESTSPYAGDFVFARRTHRECTEYADATMRVTKHVETYRNPRPVSVALCEKCFWAIWLRNMKRNLPAVWLIILFPTLLFLLLNSFASQEDRWFARVFYTFIGLMSLVLLWSQFQEIKEYRRREVSAADISRFMKSYAEKRMRESGFFNVVLTPEEWTKLEGEHTDPR